jgi:PiT family inorganic phosphate transporter
MILWAVYLAGVLLSCLMAWSLGANDAANPTDCAVGAGVISVERALVLFAVFSALGGILIGSYVMKTFDRGLVDRKTGFETGILTKETLVLGSLVAALAAAIWIIFSTALGMPISTTHSAIGGVLGFGLASAPTLIVWDKLKLVVLSIILSPLLSLATAAGLFYFTRFLFTKASKKGVLTFVGILVFLILFSTSTSAAAVFVRDTSQIISISLATSGLGSVICLYLLSRKKNGEWRDRVLTFLLILSLSFSAFSFGANDLANATGVFVTPTEIMIGKPTRTTMLLLSVLGALFVAFGGLTWGRKVLITTAYGVTRLDPLTGFAAEFANATNVFLFTTVPAWLTGFGLPISTTHSTVGSIIGVGLASRGLRGIHAGTTTKILIFWALTIPCAALISAVMFKLVSLVL